MEKTFESSLDQLEAIVRQLEEGDLPLEKSLELFEQGIKLSRECRDTLTRAERRIEVLMKETDGSLVLQDLETDSPPIGRQSTGGKRVVFEDSEDDDS